MQYLSIDIETSGLNPETCQVLEFAAVLDDLANPKPIQSLPCFQRYVFHETYQGEGYAIWMNAKYFEKRAKFGKGDPNDQWDTPANLMKEFYAWLQQVGYRGKKIIAAGKNYKAFDEKFISKLPNYQDRQWHYRSLDPATYFLNPEDSEPPSTDTCLERAGIKRVSQHNAKDDAIDIIELLRKGLKLPR